MRIAFILQTHKNLRQIAQLIGSLHRGCTNKLLVISHDGPDAERSYLSRLAGVDHVLPSRGGRGQFSLVESLVSSLRRLESQPLDYEWIVTLSGQDYPIRPLWQLEQELDRVKEDGLFYHFRAGGDQSHSTSGFWWSPREIETRYYFTYSRLKDRVTKLDRAIWKIPRHILDLTHNFRLHTSYGLNFGRRAEAHPFNGSLHLYGGSNWLTIRRRAVRELLRFFDTRPDVVSYFRTVLSPEEAFMATALANNKALRLSPRDLRYCDFNNSRHGHPRIITPELLPTVLESGYFFARKFDADRTPGILDEIDRTVLAVPSSGGRRHCDHAFGNR